MNTNILSYEVVRPGNYEDIKLFMVGDFLGSFALASWIEK